MEQIETYKFEVIECPQELKEIFEELKQVITK